MSPYTPSFRPPLKSRRLRGVHNRRSVAATVWLARLTGVILLIWAGCLIVRAGPRADSLMDMHPGDYSRTTALAVQYGLAGLGVVLAALYAAGADGLRRGHRWAWIVLVVLSVLALLGIIGSHSALALLSVVPSVVMFALLL